MHVPRQRLLAASVAAIMMGALIACSGDDDASEDAANGDRVIEEALEDAEFDVDSCTLVTDEEASALAGKELKASVDSPIGCAYIASGNTIGDFTVHSYRGSGDAASEGAELAPTAELIALDGVGDDAVALNVDGSINFIVARQGDLFLVFVTTFLDVDPVSARLTEATELARTALGRLVDAA